MTVETYHCTTCDLDFPKIGSMAAHIKKTHEHTNLEDELESIRRRALNLPDDDEDEDDDEAEDELLPANPHAAGRKLEHLRRVSTVAIAERNYTALQELLVELERLETHWELCAAVLLRHSREGCKVRQLVEWVVHSDCGGDS